MPTTDGEKPLVSTTPYSQQNIDCKLGITTPKTKPTNFTTLKILSWNCRSLNSASKIQEALKHKADINLIQEVWNPTEELITLLGKSVELNQRADNYGGTLLQYDEDKLPMSRHRLFVNEDCQLSKHIIHGNKYINICSLYIPKSTKKAINEVFNNIQKQVPESEFPYLLIMGDWNVDLQRNNDQKTIMLKELCKQFGLKISSNGATRRNSAIDFAVHGKEIQLKDMKSFESSSDHKILTCEVYIECPKPSTKRFQVPNRKVAELITISH